MPSAHEPNPRAGPRGGTPTRASFARELFGPLPPLYDVLQELFSFGQNRRWRTKMIQRVAETGPGLVLDVATGTGGVATRMAEASSAEVFGIDLTHEMVSFGRFLLDTRAVGSRIHLAVAKAEQLPFHDATFDGLTFTYLLRYVDDPAATLTELARVLKPGARMANLEFAVPSNPLWHLLWLLYTRWILPLAGLPFGRGWFRVGRFLGRSISEHYRRYNIEWHCDAWRRAGMVDVDFARMSLGGGLVMWGTRGG